MARVDVSLESMFGGSGKLYGADPFPDRCAGARSGCVHGGGEAGWRGTTEAGSEAQKPIGLNE
jgi:hypothetical protein